MTEKEQELATNSVSSGRRGFLAGAGTVAGLAMLGNASALTAPDSAAPALAATDDIDAGSLPYAQLDPEAARKLGRDNYHEGMHCGEGSLNAIVTLLREEVGGPWNDIPTSAALWSKGGGVGWSSVCGAVVGSNTAISLVHGRENEGAVNKLVDEFQRWYTQEPFPTWTPPGDSGEITEKLPRARSNSILCHVSVTEWCKATGYASGSSERSERCSRVTGESAARAIELLNAEAAGNFDDEQDAFTPSSVSKEKGCRNCHFKGSDVDHGQYTRGKMDCLNCHGAAPHMPESLK